VRKIVVGTFVTLDGVMQAPGGPEEDRDDGFEHGGWSVKYWDDTMGRLIVEQTLEADALLLGRKTYEIFAAHWPRVTDPADPVAAKLNSVRKHVVSRTLREAQWNNSSLISQDTVARIAAIKDESGGDIHVAGSGNLIQTLLKHDLVDEFRLWTFPVTVGGGKRLFGNGTVPGALHLIKTDVSSTGVVIHRYERAGRLQYGSFEVDVAGSTSELWTR
jgi:dihydrofolate reductase